MMGAVCLLIPEVPSEFWNNTTRFSVFIFTCSCRLFKDISTTFNFDNILTDFPLSYLPIYMYIYIVTKFNY